MEDTFYRCPLTNLIFHDPVVADDGYIYEYLAIIHWLAKKNTSPITGEKIGDSLQPVKHFSNMVNKYLEYNPHLIDDKFFNKKPYYLFKDEFISSVLKNDFSKLIGYTNIIINDTLWTDEESSTICAYLFINCEDNDIIKNIIDNSIDYDMEDDNGTRPIHLACKYSNKTIIEHLIEKNVNIDCEDTNGNKPIHYITKHQQDSSSITKYFIAKDQIMDTFNEDGLLPIHLVTQNMTCWENIQPFLDSNCNLNIASKNGLKPLHYICRDCSNPLIIKKFISLDIDLESATEDGNNMACDELIYSNKSLDKLEKQKLVYYYLNMLFQKVNVVDSYMNNNSPILEI